MRRPSALVAALAAVAVLGIAAAGASAADSPRLVDEVAARLGIAPDQLRAAFRDALAARIDAAVETGKLTPEQGARLKERLADAKGLGLMLRGRLAMKHPALVRALRARAHRLGPIAKYLGISRQELHTELRSGKSLAQIAVAHGKTVDGLVDAIVARARARLDTAVEKSRLTRQRADELLARLTDAVEQAVWRTRTAS